MYFNYYKIPYSPKFGHATSEFTDDEVVKSITLIVDADPSFITTIASCIFRPLRVTAVVLVLVSTNTLALAGIVSGPSNESIVNPGSAATPWTVLDRAKLTVNPGGETLQVLVSEGSKVIMTRASAISTSTYGLALSGERAAFGGAVKWGRNRQCYSGDFSWCSSCYQHVKFNQLDGLCNRSQWHRHQCLEWNLNLNG